MPQASVWRNTDAGLLVLRVGLGIMFMAVHGGPKLLGGPEVWGRVGMAMSHVGVSFAPAFWGFLAACAEFFGGLCLALGMGMRPAAAFLAMTMMVATTMHLAQGDGLQVASHAIEDGVVFVGLLFLGPGACTLDRLLASRQRRRAR